MNHESGHSGYGGYREHGIPCLGLTLIARETIFRDGVLVGYLSSAGWGYNIGKNIGYGHVRSDQRLDRDYLEAGTYELEVACERVACIIHFEKLYDPGMVLIKA